MIECLAAYAFVFKNLICLSSISKSFNLSNFENRLKSFTMYHNNSLTSRVIVNQFFILYVLYFKCVKSLKNMIFQLQCTGILYFRLFMFGKNVLLLFSFVKNKSFFVFGQEFLNNDIEISNDGKMEYFDQEI